MSTQAAATLAAKPTGGTCKLCGHKVRTMHGLHIHLSTTHQMDWRKMALQDYLVEAPPAEPGATLPWASSTSSRLKAVAPTSTVGWICPVCRIVHSPLALHCDHCARSQQRAKAV